MNQPIMNKIFRCQTGTHEQRKPTGATKYIQVQMFRCTSRSWSCRWKSGVSSSVAGVSVSRHLRHAGASVLDATGGVSEVPRLYSPSVPRWCLLWWGHSVAAARWASPCVSECLSWASPRASPLTSSAVSPGQLIVMPHQYVRAWVWVRVNCDGGISKHQLGNWQVGPA